MQALKFPDLEVTQPDGESFKLPISCKENMVDINMPTTPKVSLVCLSFRANSQVCILEMYSETRSDMMRLFQKHLSSLEH